jgi:protein TonB
MSNREPLSCRRTLGAVLAGAVAALAAGAVWATDTAPPATIKPVWILQPSQKDLLRAYPRDALNHGSPGRVVIGCRVTADGTLTACAVEQQKPAKYDFGEAGLKLASHFRMETRDADGRPTAGAAVRLPIEFKLVG